MPDTSISKGDLQDLMKQMTSSITQAAVAAVQEAKKPDPEVAAKLQEEKDRAERTRNEMLEAEQTRLQVQACTYGTCDCEKQGRPCSAPRCSHKKENGRWAVGEGGGQVFSDGKKHPICLRCGYEFPPVAVQIQDMAGSVV